MENDTESAIEYARRNGLFCHHGEGIFSPHAYIEQIQGSIDRTPPGDEALLSERDIQTNFDKDEDLDVGSNEPPRSIRVPCMDRYQLIQSMLLEAPDLGPAASHLKQYSEAMSAMLCPNLFKANLPLASADVREDQGLEFPPHIHRLHQALRLEVENEQISFTALREEQFCGHSTINNSNNAQVFSIDETPITPASSPKPRVSEPKAIPAKLLAAQTEAAKVCEPTGSTETMPTENSTATEERPNTSGSRQISVLAPAPAPEPAANDITATRSSFFEDAFFTDLDWVDPEDESELNAACRVLDKIESLLVPVPTIQAADPATLETQKVLHSSVLKQGSLPLISMDPEREAALLWVPLPPAPETKFDEEQLLIKVRDETKPEAASSGYRFEVSSDVELEERPELASAPVAEDTEPPDALSLLVKQHLQQDARPPGKAASNSKTILSSTPLLPRADDPGATSALVSAFMTLRPKRPRLGTH